MNKTELKKRKNNESEILTTILDGMEYYFVLEPNWFYTRKEKNQEFKQCLRYAIKQLLLDCEGQGLMLSYLFNEHHSTTIKMNNLLELYMNQHNYLKRKYERILKYLFTIDTKENLITKIRENYNGKTN